MALVIFLRTFWMIFLAELGDKTQLATLAQAADAPDMKKWVFLGSALALVSSSLLAAYCGGFIRNYISEKTIGIVSGAVFILFGLLTLRATFR